MAGPIIRFDADLRPLQRAFLNFHSKQVPFATSLALNKIASGIAQEERSQIDDFFDSPTPFTQNAFRVEASTKAKLYSVVAAKDIQAIYLAPYVFGGLRSYGNKKAMLLPKGVKTNQYGNLSKGQLRALAAKPNIFVGKVTTRSGTVSGVWQRPATSTSRATSKSTKPQTGLKLLIQFSDTTPVKKRLDFYGVAKRYVARNARSIFDDAIRRALATAR